MFDGKVGVVLGDELKSEGTLQTNFKPVMQMHGNFLK